MNKIVSNETSLKPAGAFAIKNAYEDLGVTQYNSRIFHGFAKLNIEKASIKIDRKALDMFNVYIKSS